MNIIERMLAPTPRFFKVLRNIGLALTAASGVILAAPISLPAVLVSIAGYLALGGSVLSAVSQLTVDDGSLQPAAPAMPVIPGSQKGKGKGGVSSVLS